MTRLPEVEAHIANMGELLDIVGAMRSLASMRVQEAHRMLPDIRRYAETMAAAIAAAFQLMPEPRSEPRSVTGRRALVLCTAEHGFVGGFSEHAFDAVQHVLGRDDALFVLGSRGALVAQERRRPTVWAHPMAARPEGVPEIVSLLTVELYRWIARGELARVEVMFARHRQGSGTTSSGDFCFQSTSRPSQERRRDNPRRTTCRLRYCSKSWSRITCSRC
jgi:F-type H+-transporting ATPase subunit gamma